MAISALTVATVKPQTLQTHHPKPSLSFKPIANCISSTKRPVLDVGIGLLAASVVALSPLEATATRIEYYATVGEPNCELNFAKSGLGYCDVAVGSGEEAPFGELINVSRVSSSPKSPMWVCWFDHVFMFRLFLHVFFFFLVWNSYNWMPHWWIHWKN